jgi:hypothetical protein
VNIIFTHQGRPFLMCNSEMVVWLEKHLCE